ncbi:MAG: ABC transporter ATP-binding protein, partial [Verrucomicrobiota bacterium]|nr:ABC transporter ATP-binding protein [Verrucomicrobiota bacterium]
MINKINMEKKIKKRTIYRLLNYAWKYKWRFSYGILAGALVGLSIFGMLSSLDNLFDPDAIEESTLHIQAETIKKTDYTEKILYFFGYEKLNDDGTLTFPATALILLVLPFFIALKGLFTYINCYCMRYVGTSTIADIRNDLFKNLSNQSLQFYSKNSAGNLISRIFNDTGVSEQLISSSIADLTRGPMEIFACFVFIIYQTVKLEIYSVSFAFIIGAPLCIFPVFLLGRKIKKMTRKSLEKISLLTMHMLETFTGIRVVKAYHMEKSECKRFVANNQKYVSKVLKGMKYELLVTPAMEFVAVLIICIFIIYTYCQGLVFKDIAPFGVAASLAYQPLKRISKVFANMQRSLMGAERAFDYIDLVPDLVETEGAIKISNFKDSFQFKNVDFSYEAQGEKIIDCLNLEIKKGETVAFVGETGSGKTTISNLLARF